MTKEEREARELEILRQNSPASLPNNPSQSGWTAEQIKNKYYAGLAYLYSLLNVVRNSAEDAVASANELIGEAATKAYVNGAVAAAVENALKAMGSVATYADLPENPSLGDTYNVLSTGDDYQWDGTNWNKLAGDVVAGEGVAVSGNTVSSLTTATDVVIRF